MKKIILSCLCLFALTFNYGQGSSNLGFNQVLNLNFSASYSYQSQQYKFINAGTITVPNNKVYKITSGSAYSKNGSDAINFGVSIKVGEHIIMENSTTSSTSAVYFPIWLSAGTYNIYLSWRSNSNATLFGAISVVEFNIE